ncbi:phosphoribosyltransferase-like protein [Paraclostridium dentum]|uniref:phosphoribosyltransferase-like protein n=1 Tax=Paraclostridium dentum TaxID=2662455 RepID=UPI003463B9C8
MQNNIINIDEIIRVFIEKYGEETYYTRGIKEKLLNWINNTEDIEIKNILLELFNEFKLFNKLEIKQIMEEQLIECLRCVDIDYTNICHFPSVGNVYNSSSEMIPLIREIDREKGNIYLYKDTIVHGIEEISDDIESVIFFDDISGTGGTIIKFLEKNIDFIREKEIYINLVAITKVAKIEIDKFKQENNDLKIYLKYKYEFDKAFEHLDRLECGHKDKIHKFEEDVWGQNNKNILGYEDSQLLVGFEHNIPNNTISSFWLSSDMLREEKKWNPLFHRYTPRRRPKKNRKNQNRNAKKLGG